MHNNDTSAFNSTPIPHDYTKSLTSPVTPITLYESTPRAHSVEQTTPFTKSNNTMPDTTRFNTNVTLSSVNTSSHDFSPYTSKLTDSATTDLYAEMSTISLKNIEARGTKYDKLYYILFLTPILFIACFFVFRNYIMKISPNRRSNHLSLDTIDSQFEKNVNECKIECDDDDEDEMVFQQ